MLRTWEERSKVCKFSAHSQRKVTVRGHGRFNLPARGNHLQHLTHEAIVLCTLNSHNVRCQSSQESWIKNH